MSVDLRAIVRHRGVQATITLWVIGYVLVVLIAGGSLPFDRPAVAALPFALQLAAPSITLIEILVLMGLVFLLTRRRVIPDIASRAPHRQLALRETLLLIGYAALGQVGGWILGPALGYRAFSFHIAGTVFGCSVPPQRGEMWTWALYNFVVFALLPYVYFRRRLYKHPAQPVFRRPPKRLSADRRSHCGRVRIRACSLYQHHF
jgi:hypothetical protein